MVMFIMGENKMSKGNKLIDDHIQISVNLVRLKTHGKTFETAIEADKAVAYKEGEAIDIDEIVQSDNVFTDMKKGLIASDAELNEIFNTTNTTQILKTMLDEGEIQFTQKYRTELRERKTNKIINLVHINAIDPKTGLPHPENRIKAAMEEARIKINDLKKAEDQIEEIIQKLRPIIPISMERVVLRVHLPPQYSAKIYSKMQGYGKVSNEQWLNDGGLQANIEMPAGMQGNFIDLINDMCHGACTVDVIERKKQ